MPAAAATASTAALAPPPLPQYVVTAHLFAAVPTPLPADADPLLFSEGRARQHLDVLARQIGHRQVGGP